MLSGTLTDTIISLLDQILLILMNVEILYTVQVSFREHVLAPEPFLIVVLIAATRRWRMGRNIRRKSEPLPLDKRAVLVIC